MTTSTQAMNNVSKVQTQTSNTKPKQNAEQIELNFNDLFSSAMGQMAPNAQLNSIESQLRESLFKQDSKANKKGNESNSNAEAAQAAVWAQRDWMQQAKVPQVDVSAPPAASTGNNAMAANKEPVVAQSKPLGDSKANDETGDIASKGPVAATESANSESDAIAETPAPALSANTALATAPVSSQGTSIVNAGVTELADNAAQNAQPPASGDVAGNMSTELAAMEQATLTNTDGARPEAKSAGNAKVDAVLSNSTVTSTRADQQTATAANNAVPSNSVAAQLAPQIAQQAQNLGDSIEPEGLKVGQKILATGSLQSAGTANGIAAGTNGLNGSLGNVPQTLIKTPVNQPGFAKEVGQTVQWAIGKNLSTVDIRVNPESFGPMNMRLVQKGQQVQLVIRTQDEASANLLTQALGGLKEVLAQNGLQLNQVQIQHGNTNTQHGQGNQNQAQFEQQGNGQNRGGQQSGNEGSSEQDATLSNVQPVTARKAEGKLDLFA